MTDETCDRCGFHDFNLYSYGFGKIGFHLCRVCSAEWEKSIRSKHSKYTWKRKDWGLVANDLLTDFVIMKTKEKVLFN